METLRSLFAIVFLIYIDAATLVAFFWWCAQPAAWPWEWLFWSGLVRAVGVGSRWPLTMVQCLRRLWMES